jgi:type IV pilus assembly protein PilM
MMGFLRRNRLTTGLDVGSGGIRAVVVDHSTDAPRLLRLASRTVDAGAIVDGEVVDLPLVAGTVRTVLQALGVRAESVVTAVGGPDVIVKKIVMSRMTEAAAREVIRWEAEQYVPFEVENAHIDFQILDPRGEGNRMDVLLVAAKREPIDQRLFLLSLAGVEPAVVDVDAFALFNAFEHNYPGGSRALAALVNIGYENATVVVHHAGVPVLTREVPFGSKHLHEALQRVHGLSSDDAEAATYGRSPRGDGVDRLLAERCGELAAAVERAVGYLDLEGGPGPGPVAIHLSGEGARIPGVQEAISDRLRTRVEVVNPLQRLEVAPEALGDLPDETTAAMWMVAVGLGLRVPRKATG